MFNKNYIFTLVETTSDTAYSTTLSKTRCVLIFLIITCIFSLITFPIAKGFYHAKTNYQLIKLRSENTILKRNISLWDRRIKSLESTVNDLQKSNNRLKDLTFHSLSNIEYGVGGPESNPRIGFMNLPETKHIDLNLSKLETETKWLKTNIIELEKAVLSRKNKISHYPSIKPIQGGWISSPYGKRIDPFTEKTENHLGIDISTRPGSQVFASADGIVKAIRTKIIKNKGYGKYIIINHGFGYETLYAHLSKVLVKKGQKVKRWDVIGLSGNTGKSTSPHLHYSVISRGMPQDPMNFILE